jgi:lysophospholipase L1-like esterase
VRRLLLSILLIAYYALVLFLFLGLVAGPWRLPAGPPLRLAALGILLASALAAPPLLALWIRSSGGRAVAFSLVPLLLLGSCGYLAAAARYYHGQVRPFDPFLQNPPHPLPAPAADGKAPAFRILAMGGSTTDNGEMAPGTRYPERLEQLLNAEHPGLATQVANAGRDWWTSRHSLIHYGSYAREWKPHVVVVMHAINDVVRSFSPEAFAMGEYDELYSHFYGPAITGARPPSFPDLLLQTFFTIPFDADWYPASRHVEVDYPIERYVSLPRFQKNLESLVHSVRADGAAIVLMTEPTLIKAVMSEEERAVLRFGRLFCATHVSRWRTEYASPRSLGAAMTAYNDTVRRVAREQDVTLIDLAAQLPQTLEIFHDDVHYTEKGTREVARHVADGLAAEIARREEEITATGEQ